MQTQHVVCQKNSFVLNGGISGGEGTTLAPIYSIAYHRNIKNKLTVCFRYIQGNANEKFDVIVIDDRAYPDFKAKYLGVSNTSANPVVDITNFKAYNISFFYPLYDSAKESFNLGIGATNTSRHKLKNIESGTFIEYFYFNTYSDNFFTWQVDLQYKRKIMKECNLIAGGYYIHKISQFAGNIGIEVLF